MTDIPEFKSEGFWWARWHTAASGTDDDGDCCEGNKWEPVEVFLNDLRHHSSNRWRVSVLGVSKSQPPGNFEWGEFIAKSPIPPNPETRGMAR